MVVLAVLIAIVGVGVAWEIPRGAFYAPNITPDPGPGSADGATGSSRGRCAMV